MIATTCLRTLFVLLISASIASCGSSSSKGGGPTNNTVLSESCANTNIIDAKLPSSNTFGILRNASDVDCFKFTLTTERTIAISTSGSTNTFGKLYYSNGSLLESDESSGSGANFLIERVLSAGTYYVEVATATRFGGRYTFNIAQSLHNNNGGCPTDRATVISAIPYASIAFRLDTSQDIDCFKFTLTTARALVISTSGFTNTFGRLYDSSGSLLRSNNDSGSSRNFLIGRTLSAGTYYVEVTTSTSNGGSYTLNLNHDFTDVCLNNAGSLLFDIASSSLLLSSQDADCFRFTLDARHTITLSTMGLTNTFGRLYDVNGSFLTPDNRDNDDSNFLIKKTLNAGTYYVEVTTTTRAGGSYAAYISFLPPSCHPGNFASISSIPYSSFGFSLSPAGDRDCFRFTLNTVRTVTISTTSSIDTFGQLYTSSGSLIESDDQDGNGNNFEISRTLSAGTYYVEVSPFSGRSAIGPYTLHVAYTYSPGTLSHLTSVPDTSSLHLNGAYAVTTAVVGGTTYLFVSGEVDNGVSVFRVNSGGSLTNVDNVGGISGARGLDTAVIGGSTYLYVTAGDTGGVYVYRVNSGGTLTSIGNSRINHLSGSARNLITVTVGSNTYGYITSRDNDKLAGILLSSSFPFQVLTQQLLSDSSLYELDGALGLATAVVGGNTYLYVTGFVNDGITVFQIPSVSTQDLTYIARYRDTFDLELNGASSVTSAYIGGTPYLFVAGYFDDGVSIFRINNGGTLSHVDRITDKSGLALYGASAVTTAVLSGNTYLFVGGHDEDGISVFRISSSGIATHITTVFDTSSYELNGVRGLTTAVVGGNLYLFAAGEDDDGVSVFWVGP